MGISIPKQIFKHKRKNSIEIYAINLKSKASCEHPLYQGCSFGCLFVLARHNLFRGTRVPGIVAKSHPVDDEARRGWRSGQNLSALQAETNFGHRKRGCEATSSPFVYHRQSCGDNYRFCFTAILLAFPI